MARPADDSIRELLATASNVAVIGASNRRGRPAFYVPQYLARSGYQVFPVNPSHAGERLWDQRFVSRLAQLTAPIDIVNVFRRSQDVPGHLEDILDLSPRPRAVWLQLGIRNDDAAARLEAAGIQVIQDRCILIEHRVLA